MAGLGEEDRPRERDRASDGRAWSGAGDCRRIDEVEGEEAYPEEEAGVLVPPGRTPRPRDPPWRVGPTDRVDVTEATEAEDV